MNIVLTMAGKYERFRLFGNKVPKYLMPLGKSTVLWHIINEYSRVESGLNFYLIANESDRDFDPVIKSVMRDFSIPKNNIIYIHDTKSQLNTAIHILDSFSDLINERAAPITFANIDTIVVNRRSYFDTLVELSGESSIVDVFQASSTEYSYILPDDDKEGHVRRFADHSRLSNLACSGLYGFGSIEFFEKECMKHLNENDKGNFTSLYSSLLQDGRDVTFSACRDVRDTLVLGTPEEYVINLHRFS